MTAAPSEQGATCHHGEPEGRCASCAACAACDGSCGTCPYASSEQGGGVGLSAEEREALAHWDDGDYTCACTSEGPCKVLPCQNKRDDLFLTVERILAARADAQRAGVREVEEWRRTAKGARREFVETVDALDAAVARAEAAEQRETALRAQIEALADEATARKAGYPSHPHWAAWDAYESDLRDILTSEQAEPACTCDPRHLAVGGYDPGCPECGTRGRGNGPAPRWRDDGIAQMLGIAEFGCATCGAGSIEERDRLVEGKEGSDG